MGFKRSFDVVQAHCGEPMHVITGGVPTIPGDTVYEQMKWMRENDDQVRNLVLKEPRGYPPVNYSDSPRKRSTGGSRIYHHGAE